MVRGMDRIRSLVFGLSAVVTFASVASASSDAPAYKVNGKTYTESDAAKKDQSAFYELEKKKFDHIEDIARGEYLDQYWNELAKKKKVSAEKAKEDYIKSQVKVGDKEINELLERLKDHPQLSKLSKEERTKQVRDYLSSLQSQKVLEDILEAGKAEGKLQVLFKQPEEPVFDMKVSKVEPVRYGPKPTDTKPMKNGCEGDSCPITVIEYSEFACPYCARMLPDTSKVLESYQGKIRWFVRDFIVHEEAVRSGVAAKCALNQGKYWEMYYSIFEKQKEQSDEDLMKRAKEIGLKMPQFTECYTKNAKKTEELVRQNSEGGRKFGVNGTPAFFINGRKLSGALPFAEFKRVIDAELSKKKS